MALLLNANEVVSADRLIEELYGSDPSGTAANALQAQIYRLRRLLDEGAENGGEMVVAEGARLPASRRPGAGRRNAVRAARSGGSDALAAGDPVGAGGLLREALALWRGQALVDVPSVELVQAEARRLEELRLAALTDRIEGDLAAGRGGELVPELEALVAANPLQERLRGQLMLALYRAGRQADALAVYQDRRSSFPNSSGWSPARRCSSSSGRS